MRLQTRLVWNLIGLHAAAFAAGTALFILFFQISLFDGIDILFYRGMLLIVLAGLCVAAGLVVMRRRRRPRFLDYKDVVLAFVMFVSVQAVLFTHLPVLVDRSVSVFVLRYMDANADRIVTAGEVEKHFIEKYVIEGRAMERRFHEQIASGTVERVGNGYRITARGKRMIGFFDVIRDLFRIKN